MKYLMSFLQSGIRCCNFLNDNKDDILPMARSYIRDNKERAVYVFIYKNDAADEIIARVNFNNSGEDPSMKGAARN